LLRYRSLAVLILASTILCHAQSPLAESIVLNHLVVVYRAGMIPADAEAQVHRAGARLTSRLDRFGMLAVSTTDATATQTRLAAQPNVVAVLHDRLVKAHTLLFREPLRELFPFITAPIEREQMPQFERTPASPNGPYVIETDNDYTGPQGWAVQAAGGYGDNVPNGSAITSGPWNISKGAGVRIAVLDSGVDANHPDIAPNLALNLSEVDQTALPSVCDDGSPQDQSGHGTWTASLAAGAFGIGTGLVAGVAPQATLLNIKVIERMPGTGATIASACEAGQPSGLLSWVLQGINDAVANHADIVSLSLGTLVDITTGDGAGWKAQFDAVTYAAAQSGMVIVAALGNDGLNLSPTGPNSRFLELPAQARSVLPVTASTNPACAENIIAGATCAAGLVTRPYYANYGATGAIAAPGGSYPEGTDSGVSGFVMGACSSGLTNTTDGLPANGQSFGCFGIGHAAYIQAMGTSASAPLVAGAAAILRAAHPAWPAAQIVAALQSSATQLTTSSTPQLNLANALAAN
jgi:subtilisin family serine protease